MPAGKIHASSLAAALDSQILDFVMYQDGSGASEKHAHLRSCAHFWLKLGSSVLDLILTLEHPLPVTSRT